jgi:hypothetical protein
MIHNRRKISQMSLCILVLVGCGGGGSDGDALFVGRWDASVSVSANTCAFGPVERAELVAIVNQVDERVAVEINGIHFSGFTTSETTYTVTSQGTDECVSVATGQSTGQTASHVFTYTFELDEKDSGRVSLIENYGNCSGNVTDRSCKVESFGIARRSRE